MTLRTKIVLATLWAVSLLITARWTAGAQVSPQLGQEVRFMRSQSDGRIQRGVLVANFGGQWLPVELDTMPDANQLLRPR